MPVNRHAFGIDEYIAMDKQAIITYTGYAKLDNGQAWRDTANAQLKIFTDALATNQSNYLPWLKKATGQKWISSAVQERCRRDPNAPDCLTNAQIDELIAQIIVK